MAGNYHSYPYGSAAYSQNQQSFQDQYASNAPQSSQAYSHNDRGLSGQPTLAAQQQPAENPTTAQYNGLHFPAPAPVRQTTSHDGNRLSAITTRDSAAASYRSSAGSASGHDSAGLYPPSNLATSTQSSRPRADETSHAHDRAEQTLPASAWSAVYHPPSTIRSISGAVNSTDRGYSYQKPDSLSQHQSYLTGQKTSGIGASSSTAPSTASVQKAPYSGSTSRPFTIPDSRQATGQYQQLAHNATPSASILHGKSYEASTSRTDTAASVSGSYQVAHNEKAYQDESGQGQAYLYSTYTLPHSTSIPSATEMSNSYSPNANDLESPSHGSSRRPLEPNANQRMHAKAAETSRSHASDAPTFTQSYAASAGSQPNQQYYHSYNPVAGTGPHTSKYDSSTNLSNKYMAAPSATQPKTGSTSQPTPAPKRQRKSASGQSPGAKIAKSRTPKQPKASTVATTPVTIYPIDSSLPPKNTLYPTADPPSMTHRGKGRGKAKTPKNGTPKGGNQSQEVSITVPSMPDQPPPAAPVGPQNDMLSMEQHMREMVEKMREYQAKDPSKFQKVWENVKRTGPAATVNSPGQGTPTIPKPAPQAIQQPGSSVSASEGDRNTPVPGSATSEAQKTFWPASQKSSLSKATSKFFCDLGQECSESFATSLLDYGPTFTELCQGLEAQGYKFERNKLATELLKTSKKTYNTGAASAAAPAISAATPASLSVISTKVPNQTLTPRPLKSFNPRNIKDSIPTALSTEDHDEPHHFVVPSMIYREVCPPSPQRYGSNTEPENPSEHSTTIPAPVIMPVSVPSRGTAAAKVTSIKKRVSMSKRSQALEAKTSGLPQASWLVTAAPQTQTPVAPQPSFSQAACDDMTASASSIMVPVPTTSIEGIYSPAGPWTLYSPSSVEDSAAIQQLQSKFEAQMSRFKSLDSPSQPPPLPPPKTLPSSQPSKSPAAPPPRKNALPRPPALDKQNAVRTNQYNPGTVVHAILLGTGRHPRYEGLNNGLAILKRLHPEMFDNRVDLAHIPWDIYDPPPTPLPGEERRIGKGIALGEEVARGRKRESVPLPIGTPRAEPVNVVIRGKRGRPRGSRGVPRGGAAGRGKVAGSATGTPNTQTASGDDSSTAANSHNYGVATGVSTEGLGNSGAGGGVGGGRKRKHSDGPHSRKSSDAWGSNSRASLLPVFKCQWEKCKSELQNLETLHRHLTKKHKLENNQGVLPCCWGDCGSVIPIASQDPENGRRIIEQHRKRHNFGTGLAWDNHVFGEHLKLVREELGEGMSVKAARSLSRGSSTHSVENRIRSMSRDRDGHSVTPVITPAPFGYKFTPPPGFSSSSQFRLAHEFENGLPDEKRVVEEELARAERTGVGTEGCTLSMVSRVLYSGGELATKARKLTKDLSALAPNLDLEGTGKGNGGEMVMPSI
ncbi:hypothetical protein DRE_05250 [Drechslerella stenobrocha 248]|uniref:C2H2-type domain-containing protein n=1 Tax=Drechslerella stenobrocha 248 TaxID=1043628 RepID=W7HR75_9PEZI|nr:hypothetical protein DRE_05250 [Drechslerella stenobrocha 248]